MESTFSNKSLHPKWTANFGGDTAQPTGQTQSGRQAVLLGLEG